MDFGWALQLRPWWRVSRLHVVKNLYQTMDFELLVRVQLINDIDESIPILTSWYPLGALVDEVGHREPQR